MRVSDGVLCARVLNACVWGTPLPSGTSTVDTVSGGGRIRRTRLPPRKEGGAQEACGTSLHWSLGGPVHLVPWWAKDVPQHPVPCWAGAIGPLLGL